MRVLIRTLKIHEGKLQYAGPQAKATRRILKLLLMNGPDPGSRDDDGRPPFSLTAGRGLTDVIKLLLAVKGVNLDFNYFEGIIPFSWATAEEQQGVIAILLAIKGLNKDAIKRPQPRVRTRAPLYRKLIYVSHSLKHCEIYEKSV